MTSFGDVQYPQYPAVDTAPGYNYEDLPHSRGGNPYTQPVIHEDHYTSSGSSGYGESGPTGYGPPSHYPSHSDPTGTGYGDSIAHNPHPHVPHYAPPPPPPPQPAPTKASFFGGLKKGGNSAMAALTLLSFFFFVNALQNCLKEHMDTMNPTVMVMTNPVIRHRNSKFSEMNSREQQNDHHINEAAEATVPVTATATVSAPSISPATIAATLTALHQNKPNVENNVDAFDANPPINDGASFDYNNQTVTSPHSYPRPNRYRPENYYNDDYRSPYYEDTHHWSQHRPHTHHHRHRHDESREEYWDHYNSRNYPNHDFYDDGAYLRIY